MVEKTDVLDVRVVTLDELPIATHVNSGSRRTEADRLDKAGIPGGGSDKGKPGGPFAVVVVVHDRVAGAGVIDLIGRYTEQIMQEEATASKVVDALLPEPATVLRPVQVAQLARSVTMAAKIEKEFGYYTGPQVGQRAGSSAQNLSATATRWRGQGRIFAITRAGVLYYPAFQFTPDGQPKDVVARVITALGSAGQSGWALASWFTSLNAYLATDTDGARRPVDVMDTDPDAVRAAAESALDSGP